MKLTKDSPRNAVYMVHTSTAADIILIYIDEHGNHRAYIDGTRETFYDVCVQNVFGSGDYHAHIVESFYRGSYRDIPKRDIKRWMKHARKCRKVVGDNHFNILAWLGGFNPLKK